MYLLGNHFRKKDPFPKSGAKVQKKPHICKFMCDFFEFCKKVYTYFTYLL